MKTVNICNTEDGRISIETDVEEIPVKVAEEIATNVYKTAIKATHSVDTTGYKIIIGVLCVLCVILAVL